MDTATFTAFLTYALVMAITPGPNNIPVSYTHLDVYKRQPRYQSPASLQGPSTKGFLLP